MELSQTLIAVVIAASGFLFCNWCILVRYSVARDTGQRLYLTAALCGAVLYLITYLLFRLQSWLWVDVLNRQPIYEVSIPLESFVAQLSLLVSGFLTVLINSSATFKAWLLDRAWIKDDLESLCMEASAGFKPVSITLDNRKVYIGYIWDSLEPGRDSHLTILPLYSGYRDDDKLEMHVSRKYVSVFKLLEELTNAGNESNEEDVTTRLDEYRVVIPRSRLLSVNLSVSSLYGNIDGVVESF